MESKAYIQWIEVDLELASKYHEIKSKIALGCKLTPLEHTFYTMFKKTIEEKVRLLKNEKNRNNEK